MSYNDEELNDLTYELALKNDIRTFFQYYISLLKAKHILIFTFCNNKDYNSKIIKINLFLYNLALYLAINTLFFDDNTMHRIYEDKGSFNLNYQLPQIIYSSFISSLFNIILKTLALSEGLILEFKSKKENENKNLDEILKKLNYKIKIKFFAYFMICSIFLIFFWFYLSIFCAIYVNIQIHLIKNSLISYILSLVYPLGINLIPGIFRILALSSPKLKRNYLYNISKILQLI